jgi:hypothetical protein
MNSSHLEEQNDGISSSVQAYSSTRSKSSLPAAVRRFFRAEAMAAAAAMASALKSDMGVVT